MEHMLEYDDRRIIMNQAATLTSYLPTFFARYKVYLISLCITAIIAAVFDVSVNYKLKEIIDRIGHDPQANVGLLLLLFVVYKMMYHGMFFIRRLLDIAYKPVMLSEIVTDMYHKTTQHSLHWFDSHLSGEISNKITDFMTNITTVITYCFRLINSVATILISIAFMLKVNGSATIVLIVFMLVYTPVIVMLLKKQLRLQEEYVMARQETMGIINDSIANIFGIKIIGSVLAELKHKVTPSVMKWRDWDKKTRQFDAYFVDSADTIMITVMGAAQIYLLAYLYRNGEITAGGFAFIAITTLAIHKELNEFLDNLLFNINPGIASMKASYSFVNCHIDTEDAPNAIALQRCQGEIRYNNVRFAYSGNGTDVLHDFSLHIRPGERLGIVGTSGAGKTTLIKCLLRYFDIKQGTIIIDGKNIAEMTQESLRANISVIPQDITMFHRTIIENLQLAKPDATEAEIVEACKKARIHEDIMRMSHGYESVVGERGVKVSGGQRQRIAIARAILKNAPILILDEATSALDTPTEQLIQGSLNEMLETNSATVIAIAHRLSTLKYMDRIIVLDKGTIMEEGTHDELIIRNNGLYKKLWEMQAI